MKKPVLVLGGGIAGIQAALDLAEMDVPVFIVENSPSIGGRMAQLDKTFPTNDCSACILAPKVTSCYNHPLIKTFTWSELLELRGNAPDFTAVIKKKARFIDEDLCKGCNACIPKCPIEKKSEFDMGVGNRRAVYKPYAQAVPNKVVIDKKGTSPCKFRCPAHMDAHGYVALAGQGRYQEALEVVRRTTPFAGVLGRICTHPCETGCARQYVDSPVSLASLKRFLADYEVQQGITPKIKVNAREKYDKVAVIGSGPAGLNCAYQLALEGYRVTVFEALPVPGGMLRAGIPDYRLDKQVLEREIQIIKDLNVEIICNNHVGKDLTLDDLRERGYKAFLLATGHYKENSMETPGAVKQTAENNLLGEAGVSCFDKNGRIICSSESLETGIPGVFAGGAAVTGPSSMINAIAQGNMAARSIRNYLEGTDLPLRPFILPETPLEEIDFSDVSKDARVNIPVPEMDKSISTFEEAGKGLTEEQAKKEALRCVDCSICCECRICEKMCGSKAIRHEQQDEIIELQVSSLIFANGYDTSSEMPDGYGYGKYRDVVTSLEYERILSASGPYQGHIRRLSDGKAPERIAFIQCAGSRDEKCGSGYCSAVCCMYAVKEAVITKEHLSSVRDIDIFYMDMRAYGKDFDKYVDSAVSKHSIGFVRSRVSDVKLNGLTGGLIISYCDDKGNQTSGEYDLVVLSVGLKPNIDKQGLFGKIGVKTDKYGFLWVNEMNAPKTSREGILACGAITGPKDIPETVVEASAAASEASKTAGSSFVEFEEYNAFFKKEEDPVLRDVSKEPVRIGVFLCHCGKNIGDYLDVKDVVKYAKTLPYAEYATDFMYACSIDSQKVMAERIKKFNINRVVVASCTPRTHEPLFQGVMVRAGLNPYLLAMANIREQCSWAHMNHWEEATQKAKELVRMAVGSITHAKQLGKQSIGVTASALVIGGGVAGMTAALEIAGMGYKAYLVEKSNALGGNALKLNSTFSGRPSGVYVWQMIKEVMDNSLIEVFFDTTIKNVSGYMGNYTTTFDRDGQENGQEIEINHGAVIIATGARESKPDEYQYGRQDAVLTQMELEAALKNNEAALNNKKNIFMIQCVGSRNGDRPYCSRVCCNQAIKNAILLKGKNPAANVVILYRDIRSYGLNESNYLKARKAGIQFIRYEAELKPEVLDNKIGLTVSFYEPMLDGYIQSEADLVVLSSAVEPGAEDNRAIAQLFKVPLNQEGFFLEAHAKLRPVDFATEGVYLCGMAHMPKNMKESIIQGKAAAARAATVISKDRLETGGAIAEVSEPLCTGCAACEKVCAYKAISVEEIKRRDGIVRKAVVKAVLCKGCGTCAATCRCGAVDVNGFSDRQVLNEIEYLLRM